MSETLFEKQDVNLENLEKEQLIQKIEELQQEKREQLTRQDLLKGIGQILDWEVKQELSNGEVINSINDEFITSQGHFTKIGLEQLYSFLVDECGCEESEYIEDKVGDLSFKNVYKLENRAEIDEIIKYGSSKVDPENITGKIISDIKRKRNEKRYQNLHRLIEDINLEPIKKVIYAWFTTPSNSGRKRKYKDLSLIRCQIYAESAGIRYRRLAREIEESTDMKAAMGFQDETPNHNTISRYPKGRTDSRKKRDIYDNIIRDVSRYISENTDLCETPEIECPDCGGNIEGIDKVSAHVMSEHGFFYSYCETPDGKFICPKCLEMVGITGDRLSQHFAQVHRLPLSEYFLNNFERFENVIDNYEREVEKDNSGLVTGTEEFEYDSSLADQLTERQIDQVAELVERLNIRKDSKGFVCLHCLYYSDREKAAEDHQEKEEHDSWVAIKSVPTQWRDESTIRKMVVNRIKEEYSEQDSS